MTEWWWPILFVALAAIVTQNLLVAHSKGVIEMRSIVVKRDEQPGFFWFTFAIESFFLIMSVVLLVNWLLGGSILGQEIQ